MPKLIHQFSRMQFEAEAQRLRQDVLRLCAERNLDSAAVVAACADVVATVAATLDAREGTRTLNDRLDSFCGRVEETYERTRDIAAG